MKDDLQEQKTLILKCIALVCLLMRKPSPQEHKDLSLQILYQTSKMYYIALITVVIPMKPEYILKFCLQLDPQEADTKLLIVGEKGGDIHHWCMTNFIVTKSKEDQFHIE